MSTRLKSIGYVYIEYITSNVIKNIISELIIKKVDMKNFWTLL